MLDCSILFNILYIENKDVVKFNNYRQLNGNMNTFAKVVSKVQEYLKPTTWKTSNDGLITQLITNIRK